jgi:hypothetical protein
LTARHCNEARDRDEVSVDLSIDRLKILNIATDGQDHDIYEVSGPAFTNTVVVQERSARMGEHVTIYGHGGNDFLPVRKDGVVENELDTSDVDKGATYCTIKAIGGDSGSAIYGDDGKIVGLITYRTSATFSPVTAIGFGLQFTQSTLDDAAAFVPPTEELQTWKPVPSKQDKEREKKEALQFLF